MYLICRRGLLLDIIKQFYFDFVCIELVMVYILDTL